nr:flagellar motor switch protein FliN [Oceanococcus sp. HetDA_MAG_MS8]
MSEEQTDADMDMAAAMAEQAEFEKKQQEQAAQAGDAEQGVADQSYEPPELHAGQSGAPSGTTVDGKNLKLDLILDVPITLSMEVGRSRVPIRNLLQLNPGSVVELDRVAGQPLDVFVNGTLIAHGEVVVVNEKFGVRLLDVVSPAERIRKLQEG